MKTRLTVGIAATVAAAVFMCSCSSRNGVDPNYSKRVLSAMKNMRVGDWALYYVNRDIQVRMQVIERDCRGVTIEYFSYIKLAQRNDPTQQRFDFEQVKSNLKKGLDIYGTTKYLKMKLRKEPSMLGKIAVESEHWAMETPGVFFEQWFSDEVPLWGIIRQRRNSEDTLLIRAWGRAGEKMNWPSDITPITPATQPLELKTDATAE